MIAILQSLEESLWTSETRFDREYMEKILHPDFVEFGRSGRVYSRDEMLNAEECKIRATLPLKDFTLHEIADDVALVTYVSEVQDEEMEVGNRSSLWVKVGEDWKLRFHQGTIAH